VAPEYGVSPLAAIYEAFSILSEHRIEEERAEGVFSLELWRLVLPSRNVDNSRGSFPEKPLRGTANPGGRVGPECREVRFPFPDPGPGPRG
jgi:hypothetical protein